MYYLVQEVLDDSYCYLVDDFVQGQVLYQELGFFYDLGLVLGGNQMVQYFDFVFDFSRFVQQLVYLEINFFQEYNDSDYYEVLNKYFLNY